MAQRDFYGVRNGYAYFVYTTPDTVYDPMKAYAIARAKVNGGAIVGIERLVDSVWEHDLEGYGDITGINGATGVRHITKEQLREIVQANSKTLDPDEVLSAACEG